MEMFMARQLLWVLILSSFFWPQITLFSYPGGPLAEIWKWLTGRFIVHSQAKFFVSHSSNKTMVISRLLQWTLPKSPKTATVSTLLEFGQFTSNWQTAFLIQSHLQVQGSDKAELDWLWFCRLDGRLWRVHTYGSHHKICRQVKYALNDVMADDGVFL